jgi:hypothetical protein
MPAAYAFGGVLAFAALLVDRGSLATVFALVVTATSVAIAGVLLLLWRRMTLGRAASGLRSAESVLVTSSDPMPDGVAELIGELRRLGFEMIGAVDTAVGGRPPIRVWILAEHGGAATTWVEVTMAARPMAIFLSRAGDGRFLETSFPDGETIDHPNVFARPIGTSAEYALRDHRDALAEWTARAGPPLVVRTIDDYREVETELRERTAGLRIAAYLERVVEPGLGRWAICSAIGVVTFFVVVLLPAP